MLRHQRLHEERALRGIEPRANPVRGVVVGKRHQLARVGEVARQRVPVGDEIEAVELVLQRHPLAEGADQVADMEAARGPHAGYHALSCGHESHERMKPAGLTTR